MSTSPTEGQMQRKVLCIPPVQRPALQLSAGVERTDVQRCNAVRLKLGKHLCRVLQFAGHARQHFIQP